MGATHQYEIDHLTNTVLQPSMPKLPLNLVSLSRMPVSAFLCLEAQDSSPLIPRCSECML